MNLTHPDSNVTVTAANAAAAEPYLSQGWVADEAKPKK